MAKTYFDELVGASDDPTSEANRSHHKALGPQWFCHSNFGQSFANIISLWNAVYKGVEATKTRELDQDRVLWNEVNGWVQKHS